MTAHLIIPLERLDSYWHEAGLEALFADVLEAQKALLSPGLEPIPPKKADLARIHYLVRKRRALTTLEFGVGYSTIAIAHAHALNKRDFEAAGITRKLRNSRLFEHHVVDASRQWLELSKKSVPEALRAHVHYHHSRVEAGTHLGQLCHFYETLPNVIAEFIYLDGPDPNDVEGAVNGLDFSIPERTVMSGDLLLMESCFLPGTLILVDGRTNNARFLARNFRRRYVHVWDREGDVTLFELDEPRLGPHNILGTDLF